MSAATAPELPRHSRILDRAPAATSALRPLSRWLAESREAGHPRPAPVRRIFKVGRDLAEALTCLHLLGLTAGQVDADAVYVDAELSEAYLLPMPVQPAADHDPLESTPYRDALRADLIQLGVLLFELACRRALRPREDLTHLRQGFALVSLINPQVPPEGDAVIARLLRTTAFQGYDRAKRVLDDLRGVLASLDLAEAGGPAPAPASPTVIGRKVQDLLEGWAPHQERAPAPAPAGAPRAGHAGLRCAAAALLSVFLLLRVMAPSPPPARAAARPPAPAASAANERPADSAGMKLALARRAAARRTREVAR